MLDWISNRVIFHPKPPIYEAVVSDKRPASNLNLHAGSFKTTFKLRVNPRGPVPLTQEPLRKKLQTNSSLSAANLTACDFWMAFLHLAIPIFSLSSLWSLLGCRRSPSGEESFFSPFSFESAHLEGLNVFSLCAGRSHGIYFSYLSPSPACVWPRDPVACRSPWWMRRPCSSTYCWQLL